VMGPLFFLKVGVGFRKFKVVGIQFTKVNAYHKISTIQWSVIQNVNSIMRLSCIKRTPQLSCVYLFPAQGRGGLHHDSCL